MKIIEGHWHRLCDKRPITGWNNEGKMDRYLSRVVKIRRVCGSSICIEQDEDDSRQCVFIPEDFVEEVLVEHGSNPSKYSFEDMLCGVTYESKEK